MSIFILAGFRLSLFVCFDCGLQPEAESKSLDLNPSVVPWMLMIQALARQILEPDIDIRDVGSHVTCLYSAPNPKTRRPGGWWPRRGKVRLGLHLEVVKSHRAIRSD